MINPNDAAILEVLQRNCKAPLAEIALKVGLSVPTVSERIRKMEARGIILRYAAIVDPHVLGKNITAFIHVLLESARYDESFKEAIREIPEVLECHHTVGQYSYLLKVRTSNPRALEELLARQVKQLGGVRETMTVVALSTAKEETALPVSDPVPLAGAGRP